MTLPYSLRIVADAVIVIASPTLESLTTSCINGCRTTEGVRNPQAISADQTSLS